MPKFLVPKRSGAHRAAAIALYRALLSQCASVPLPSAQRDELRNITRNKFRRNRNVHSTRLLRLSFTAGYESLDLLDRCAAGHALSTAHITSLLAQTPNTLTVSQPQSQPQPPPPPQPDTALQPDFAPEPDAAPKQRSPGACLPPNQRELVVRPRPRVSGIRRVPILTSTSIWPFLRFKRPQPRSLSRMLMDLIKQRQQRMNLRARLERKEMTLARWEDRWDGIVLEMHGVGDGVDGQDADGDWADEPSALVAALNRQFQAQKVRAGKTARKMQNIVEQEAELAEKERRQRRERKEHVRREEGVLESLSNLMDGGH